MPRFSAVVLSAVLIILNGSIAQAKPKSGCASISKAQYNQAQQIPDASKATLDRVLGVSCSISGYGNGMSAYGYKLNYDSKSWFVVVYSNGKIYKSAILPIGMGLREG